VLANIQDIESTEMAPEQMYHAAGTKHLSFIVSNVPSPLSQKNETTKSFYVITYVTLCTDHFASWDPVQHLFVFQFSVNWCPCIVVYCIEFDVRLLIIVFKENVGNIFLSLTNCVTSNTLIVLLMLQSC
jgi:hypothetical protein